MSDRERLPNRRQLRTRLIEFMGVQYDIGLGFDENWRVKEVWCNNGRGDMGRVLKQVGVLLSHFLQRGLSPDELLRILICEHEAGEEATDIVLYLAQWIKRVDDEMLATGGGC